MNGRTRLPVAAGLLAGAALDAAVGDPRRWHPVAGFGRVATEVERRCHRDHELAGALTTVALLSLVAGSVRAIERALPPAGRMVLTACVTSVALGGRSLRHEARAMATRLGDGDLEAARHRLPSLCGRDPSDLDACELTRATIESVAENTADAVVATLVWGTVAGPAGAALHRAANTLDAMVGHRTRRHRRFGWTAARLDDLLNLAPARITALLIAALAPTIAGRSADAVRIWHRNAAGHPSPNAGPVEAAMAGALGVRLGGATNRYGDHLDLRPPMGDGGGPTLVDLDRAITLASRVAQAALLLCVAAAVAVPSARRREVGAS